MRPRKQNKGVIRADFGADILPEIALLPRSEFATFLGMK